jgi:ATP-dependent Lon protease
MSSSEFDKYRAELVRDVFDELAIDKTRLPSSGLTSLGVPSFVGEWLLDKVVPGHGPLTASEQGKLSAFVQKAFPRKDDKHEILFHLTQGQVCKLIALVQVRIRLETGKGEVPDPLARVPILNLDNCEIPTDLVERHRMLRKASGAR